MRENGGFDGDEELRIQEDFPVTLKNEMHCSFMVLQNEQYRLTSDHNCLPTSGSVSPMQ